MIFSKNVTITMLAFKLGLNVFSKVEEAKIQSRLTAVSCIKNN